MDITSNELREFKKRATIKETAEYLQMSVYAVDKLCKQGVLPYVEIGRRKYIILELAEAAIEQEALATQQRQKAAAEKAAAEKTSAAIVHMGKCYPKLSKLL